MEPMERTTRGMQTPTVARIGKPECYTDDARGRSLDARSAPSPRPRQTAQNSVTSEVDKGFTVRDIVPLTQARANLSELAEQSPSLTRRSADRQTGN